MTSLSQNWVKNTQICISCTTVDIILKSGTMKTLLQNFFSDGRTSEF